MKRSESSGAREISNNGKVSIGGAGMSLRRPRPARHSISDNGKADHAGAEKLASKK
jgi:hypothetical protein